MDQIIMNIVQTHWLILLAGCYYLPVVVKCERLQRILEAFRFFYTYCIAHVLIGTTVGQHVIVLTRMLDDVFSTLAGNNAYRQNLTTTVRKPGYCAIRFFR